MVVSVQSPLVVLVGGALGDPARASDRRLRDPPWTAREEARRWQCWSTRSTRRRRRTYRSKYRL